MAKKIFTDESLATLVDETKSYVDSAVSTKANAIHTHSISNVTNLQETLDGKASTAVATQSTDGLMSAKDKTQLDYGGIPIVSASSDDGAVYIATVNGMSALTTGAKVTIIPSIASTSTTPKLNVNGLGEKTIRMPVTYNTSATSVGAVESWLAKNKPVELTYNGTYWITTDLPRPSAQYLYGAVPVENGGTGATTEAEAIANLGAVDLSSEQTITSTKTFSNGIKIGNATLTYDDTNKCLVVSVA